jgi:hypothetical protein
MGTLECLWTRIAFHRTTEFSGWALEVALPENDQSYGGPKTIPYGLGLSNTEITSKPHCFEVRSQEVFGQGCGVATPTTSLGGGPDVIQFARFEHFAR